jgi:Icc-related predicted phosphoesterase
MKILVMSDLHTEFGSIIEEIILDDLDYDILVIAGDIATSRTTDLVLADVAEFIAPKKLFYVTGNHDFYHGNVPSVEDRIMKLEATHDNFKFLNQQVVECEFDNEIVYFLGATGWQNRKSYNFQNYNLMNDFRLIKNHMYDVNQRGQYDYEFLRDELESIEECSTLKPYKVVVVTHVPPTIDAIDLNGEEASSKAPGYISAYHNDHNDLISRYKPNLWICGHMHDTFDKVIDKTRVVRNAYGYYNSDRQNEMFDNKFIVEV